MMSDNSRPNGAIASTVITKIQEIIALYKADFFRVNEEEIYKWKAVKCFRDNWDIEAPDFVAMLNWAFEMRENLLGSSYYFPYKVLAEFARQEPETVRALFKSLYDESLPLNERISDFRKAFDPFVKRQSEHFENWKQSYQDLHAVSVYLAFQYPDKYYIFKSTIYRKLAAFVGYVPKLDKKEQYSNYTDLFDLIREVAIKDDNLTEMSRNRLTTDCFADSEYRMLAMDIAYFGYKLVKGSEQQDEDETDEPDGCVTDNAPRYWVYAPGPNAQYWDNFRDAGIMAIGWSGLGDLSDYTSKSAIREKGLGKNDALCCWQFVRDVKIGDIVIVKQGLYKIIGRGEVTGDYRYDQTQPIPDYYNIRTVNWTHVGSWDYPNSSGQAPGKTLTDITRFTDTVLKIEECFTEEAEIAPQPDKPVIVPPPAPPVPVKAPDKYGPADFLADVFMDEEDYKTLVELLKLYKNLILQGAPGVGKTFAAKRLAWSIMGEQDEDRFQIVQFHQSYSYEDFIMGFRPTKEGFELKHGVFYDFCILAAEDDENSYFFIIDEINRGNLSKIFGELLMLIERDKRGESTRLLYENEQFSVPKNLYIIGMMNTADRSLALMDYALRRRFAFFDIEPAFDQEVFRDRQEDMNNPKFDRLVEAVRKLNDVIADDPLLGKGFRIGHDRFCEKSYDDAKLRAIVEYSLIPLLSEYWVDDKPKVYEWTRKLRDAIDGG